jgi:hypothetical protein
VTFSADRLENLLEIAVALRRFLLAGIEDVFRQRFDIA